jgi:hypothetical protein
MNDKDQRIREIAYDLWEQEGCPEGQAERHWSAAVAVVEARDAEDENMEEDLRGAAFKEPPVSAPLEASSAPPPPPRARVREGRRSAASR